MSTTAEKSGLDGMLAGSPAEWELLAVLDDRLVTEELRSLLRHVLSRRGLAVCFIGQEGVGKTTAADQLAAVLDALAVPRQRLHRAAFATNLFLVPFLVLDNRYRRRRLLILDRSVYDNLAVHGARYGLSPRLLSFAAMIVSAAYPRLDVRFHLHCRLDLLRRRRPTKDERTAARQAAAYACVARCLAFTSAETSTPLLRRVLSVLEQTVRLTIADPATGKRTTP